MLTKSSFRQLVVRQALFKTTGRSGQYYEFSQDLDNDLSKIINKLASNFPYSSTLGQVR